jgi:hypothetical protein
VNDIFLQPFAYFLAPISIEKHQRLLSFFLHIFLQKNREEKEIHASCTQKKTYSTLSTLNTTTPLELFLSCAVSATTTKTTTTTTKIETLHLLVEC